MGFDLKYIYSLFDADGSFSDASAFGSGHIHDTFHIKTAEADKDDYILQRINNKVFRNVPELQDNIERVTRHIYNKLLSIPGSDIKRECLILIPSKEGVSWVRDSGQNFWRMFIFIEGHKSYDIVDSPGLALEGGKAIGRFQALLSDLPGKPLFETIPFFHNVAKRLERLNESLESDIVNRARESKQEIDFILERSEEMKIILKLGEEGKIPLRITHNDTKFNNILLDDNDNALCIIDLDTVMPGYIHYDFGDAIRTAASEAAEDEAELSKVKMNINLFSSFAEGYLNETRTTLSNIEKEYLAFAPLLITYTQAVRFLTDYLNGDTYYKIHHENHNLQRTKAQLRLVQNMEDQYKEMQNIIDNLS